MIMHLTIHHPDPEKTDDLVELARQYERQMRAQPGVLSVHTLKDAHTGVVVSLAVYSGMETWLTAQSAIVRAESAEDFSRCESIPPTVYHLEEI